jgi:hypothetical protein
MAISKAIRPHRNEATGDARRSCCATRGTPQTRRNMTVIAGGPALRGRDIREVPKGSSTTSAISVDIPVIGVRRERRIRCLEPPCHECGSQQRVIAVRYHVFGFFKAFGASWARHYFVECRQCRTTLSAMTRSEFEKAHGNAIPYGQRFGLLALGALVAATAVIVGVVGRSPAVSIALVVVWAILGGLLWRNAWVSTFTRRRRGTQSK